MQRFLMLLGIGILAAMTAQDFSRAQTAGKSGGRSSEAQYSVLNPWAEVDPIALRGISPRLQSLSGRRIGLFANFKRAARPMAATVEKRLKAMYPDVQTTLFDSRQPNVTETETANREKFIAWVKGVGAVVAMVGD